MKIARSLHPCRTLESASASVILSTKSDPSTVTVLYLSHFDIIIIFFFSFSFICSTKANTQFIYAHVAPTQCWLTAALYGNSLHEES